MVWFQVVAVVEQNIRNLIIILFNQYSGQKYKELFNCRYSILWFYYKKKIAALLEDWITFFTLIHGTKCMFYILS